MNGQRGNGQRPAILLCVLIMLAMLYLGYCLGAAGKPSGPEWLDVVLLRLGSPFPFAFTEWTGKFVGLCALAGVVLCMLLLSEHHSFAHGKEYGTARFASPPEYNRKYRNRRKKDNKIVSRNVRISRDGHFTQRNNNCLILGGSGSGKTQFVVTPNILEPENGAGIRITKIFTDPKGEILRDNGAFLVTHGMKVVTVDLIRMKGHYNPFRYIRKSIDVIKLVTNLIANTTPKGSVKGDPFWEKSEAMFLMSLFYYVWKEYPKREQSFRKVMELLGEARIPEDDTEETALDRKMAKLDADHPARLAYDKVRRGAVDTVRSIFISANARLAFLQDEEVLSVLDSDEMNIPELGRGVHFDGKSPTAVFLVIPDNDKTYNFIVGIFYTQLFQELYYQADFECGGTLPVPVEVWFDEFANIALPDDFIQILSTERSRNISSNIIIQFEDQVSALFEKLKNGIKANCDTFVYLGANDEESQKGISQRLGKYTLEKRSTSDTLGKNRSSSRSDDVLGRELLTPDEVALLGGDDEIIFMRGERPVLDKKYKPFHLPEYKEARRLGPYQSVEAGERSVMMGEKTDLTYYQKLLEEGEIESLNVLEMTPKEAMELDLASLSLKGEPGLEEVKRILEEYREVIEEKRKKEEKLDGEIREAEGKLTNKGKEVTTGKTEGETVEDRIRKYPFSDEQLEEAMAGIENGLSEESVLSYFKIDTTATKMRILRKLAEKAAGKGG